VAAAVVGGAIAVGALPTGSGAAHAIALRLHPIARFGPLYLLVELGPLFFFGMAGLIALSASRRLGTRGTMLVLLGLTVLFAFFVAQPLEPNHSLRKAIKLLQLVLVVLAADAFAVYIRQPRGRWLTTGLVVALVAGVVTLGTDIFQYVDVMGRKPQPTTYVSVDTMKVLDWIRTSTPRDAVFQVLSEVRPDQRFRETFGSLISTFGERRTLVGDAKTPQLLSVPGPSIASRRQQLERLFTARDAETALSVLRQVPLNYLYVDEALPGPVGIIRQLVASGALTETYRVDGIYVLRVKSGGHALGNVDVDPLRGWVLR
jgi:hypothetical protein